MVGEVVEAGVALGAGEVVVQLDVGGNGVALGVDVQVSGAVNGRCRGAQTFGGS